MRWLGPHVVIQDSCTVETVRLMCLHQGNLARPTSWIRERMTLCTGIGVAFSGQNYDGELGLLDVFSHRNNLGSPELWGGGGSPCH